MTPHVKHPPVSRPHRGQFAHCEVSLLGAPCGLIREVVEHYIQARPAHLLAYADADHHPEKSPFPVGGQWMDHQSFHSLRAPGQMGEWQRRSAFQQCDGALVNGNHFDASHQIALVHPDKLASLEKRLARLTDVLAVVLCPGIDAWPAFLSNHLPAETPTVKLEDHKGLHLLLDQHLLTPPPLYGLVLAGGKSTRMGTDKGLLNLHGKPQREYLTDLLEEVCEEVLVSCRPDQAEDIAAFATPLPDRISDFGPLGALMSAFMHNANAAYVVVACDMPGLDREALEHLVRNRNTSKIATAFVKSEESFPEPLCAIWEPKSYGELLAFLSQGNSCPRKVLINSNTEKILTINPLWVSNINTKEDLSAWNQG